MPRCGAMIDAFLDRKRRIAKFKTASLASGALNQMDIRWTYRVLCRSEWRACTKTCMGGMTEQGAQRLCFKLTVCRRDRHVVKHASVGGKPCSDFHHLLEATQKSFLIRVSR